MKTLNTTIETKTNEVLNAITKVKVTREQKVNISIKKLESKGVLNDWDKLSLTSKKTELETFSLSKIVKTFVESGKDILTKGQKESLTFESVKNFVSTSEKYKNKVMFSFNDVKLICNSIVKRDDKGTKIALKVTKQGGTITKKK